MLNSSLTDKELWTAIQLNDSRALRLLFERYWVRLYKTAYGLTRDIEVSKEIVHDVFINIWDRRDSLVIDSFPQFLLTAVKYQYYNRCRLARSPIVLVDDYSSVDKNAATNEGESRQIELELVDTLKDNLLPLPKRCREIFLLSRTQYLSNEEIAERLHISKRTVENQISAALHHLKRVLKNELYLLPAFLIQFLLR